MEEPESKEGQIDLKRPWGLKIACIFSFTYNGILLLLTLVSFFYTQEIFGFIGRLLHAKASVPLTTYLILIGFAFLFITTMLAVVLIWKLQLKGFYLYLIAKIILVLMLIWSDYLDYFNLGLAVFMMLVYWSYRKRLQSSPETVNN